MLLAVTAPETSLTPLLPRRRNLKLLVRHSNEVRKFWRHGAHVNFRAIRLAWSHDCLDSEVFDIPAALHAGCSVRLSTLFGFMAVPRSVWNTKSSG